MLQAILFHFLLILTAHAQLPAGFTPPAELTSGRWAEAPGPRSIYFRGRLTSRYDRRIVEILRPLSDHRRRPRPEAFYDRMVRLAEDIVADQALAASPHPLREIVARGLYLVSLFGAEVSTATPAGKRQAVIYLSNALIAGYNWGSYRGAHNRFRQGLSSDNASADFVRMNTTGVPGLPSLSVRYRIARALAVILIWDYARQEETEAAAAAAWEIVRGLPERATGNPETDQLAIAQLERLTIMPHAHMQENFRPFTPNPYSEHRSLFQGVFNNIFTEAYRCGVVACATLGSNGIMLLARGEVDGQVQESLIATCLATNASDGPMCRGNLTCNRQEVATASGCGYLTPLPEGHRATSWGEL